MKKSTLFVKGFIASVLVVAGMFLFSSCSKSVPDIKTVSVATFKLDSVAKTTLLLAGTLTTKTQVMQITGQTADGTYFTLEVINPLVGNYTIATQTAICSYSTDPAGKVIYFASTGSITINYISSSEVIGSFAFDVTAANNVTHIVSNGLFNCNYTTL